jgi:hypothetical protein
VTPGCGQEASTPGDHDRGRCRTTA